MIERSSWPPLPEATMGILDKLKAQRLVSEFVDLAIHTQCASGVYVDNVNPEALEIYQEILKEDTGKAGEIINEVKQSSPGLRQEFRSQVKSRLHTVHYGEIWPVLGKVSARFGIQIGPCPEMMKQNKFYGVTFLFYEKFLEGWE
jgi:hypothetical protein